MWLAKNVKGAMPVNLRCRDVPLASCARASGWWLIALVLFSLTLAGCGFRMQGATPLPFDTLYVSVPQNTAFGADLRRAIRAASSNTDIVNERSPPYQVAFEQIAEQRSTREVSLNAQGRVEEYELTLTYIFRLVSADGDIVLADTTLRSVRNLPFDDRVVQAKEVEEATLFAQMQQGLIARIMRRISAPDVVDTFNALQSAD
jgi:LPS-assembly lipoprotein